MFADDARLASETSTAAAPDSGTICPDGATLTVEALSATARNPDIRIEIVVDIRSVPVWTYAKPSELVSSVHEGPFAAYVLDPRYVPGEQRGHPNSGFGTAGDRA